MIDELIYKIDTHFSYVATNMRLMELSKELDDEFYKETDDYITHVWILPYFFDKNLEHDYGEYTFSGCRLMAVVDISIDADKEYIESKKGTMQREVLIGKVKKRCDGTFAEWNSSAIIPMKGIVL